MLHKTKGLVLRTVKYGETSMIVTVFTELFGLQSCLVNGVRTSSKKNASRASLFQPAALLDLVLYHQETKNLQRLKEFNWHVLYRRIFSEVIPHAVALFMIELLQKNLKQPEAQPDLFYFMEDLLTILDDADDRVIANLPLFFSIHLSGCAIDSQPNCLYSSWASLVSSIHLLNPSRSGWAITCSIIHFDNPFLRCSGMINTSPR